MRQNLLFTIGVVALLAAGALVSMQDPPKPVPVDWVTVEFNAENCDTDGFDVSWRTDYSSGVGGYVVTGVQLSGVTWFCLKQDITVYLNSSGAADATGGTVLAWAQIDGSSGVTIENGGEQRDLFFDFSDAHVAASAINGIAVAIPDRADTDTFGRVLDLSTGLAAVPFEYGSKQVYVAARAELGADDSTGVTANPSGGIVFWYCRSAIATPAACAENAPQRVFISDSTAGTPVTQLAEARPASSAESTAQTLVPGYYLFRSRFVTVDYIYYGSENSTGTDGAAMTLQVLPATTTTALTGSTPASAVWGVPLTYSARVSESVPDPLVQPTGRIEFWDQAGKFAECTVVNNECSATTSNLFPLPAGTRSVTARFVAEATGGITYYRDSLPSVSRSILITKAKTAITLDLPASSTFGSPVTLTARLQALSPSQGIPYGVNVSFRNYTDMLTSSYTTIGTCTLRADVDTSTGVCDVTTSTLAVRTHYIAAVFLATTSLDATTSTRKPITVSQPSVTVTVTPTPASPSKYGQSVAFRVDVTSSSGATVPNATISLSDGSTPLGTCALSLGTCTYTTAALDVTTHTISATYPASASIPRSTGSISYTVGIADSTTGITASVTTARIGQVITLTARVAPVITGAPVPTGVVTFTDGVTLLGTCTLSLGTCSVTTGDRPLGTRTITATYPGSSRYATSRASLTVTVVAGATTTVSALSPTAPVYGQNVVLTATVNPVSPAGGDPSGTVTFSDGTRGIGTCTLVNRTCSVTWTPVSAGSRTVYFRYTTDTANYTSSSTSRTVSVAKASTTISLTTNLGTGPLTIARGGVLTLTTEVSSGVGAPTGKATFRMVSSTGSTTTLGSPTLVAVPGQPRSTASIAYTFTKAGTYYLTVSYAGDTNYSTVTLATGSRISLVVN